MTTTLAEPVAVWRDLEPTSTHPRRQWAWVPGRGGHADHRDGTLHVRQSKGRTRGAWEEDAYGVIEGDPVGGHNPGREYLLRSDTDPDQPDVYAVFVADGGPEWDCCTCTAGQCRLKACKHRGSLRALLSGVCS